MTPYRALIKKIGRPIFTTREIVALSGKSPSSVTHFLHRMTQEGELIKLSRGLWGDRGVHPLSPLDAISHLFARARVYVSFVSALHLHGIIEQIPQVITLASTAHSKTIYTRIGSFAVHQLAPEFFTGFDWYKAEGRFLIAEPEKALVDCLYLSSRKKNQYTFFPELHLSAKFSASQARRWVQRIPSHPIRRYAAPRLEELLKMWK